MIRFSIFLALAHFVLTAVALGANDKIFIPKMPDDFDQVDFYLHTVDVGVLVHEKYGHIQIRVHDRSSNSDVAYTWGMFDYQDPGFALKFYRGIMKYKIGAYPTPVAHRIYQYEGRQVWEDRLEFTAAQKRRLMEKIIFQMEPQNREYDYQYFFDNCSTRPRDFIDTALNGEFGRLYLNQLSPFSFRDMVRSHQATTPLSGLGLEVTMNGRLDRKMTLWEEMFLPKSLRRMLMELPQMDDSGNPIAGTKLLTPIGTYYDTPTPTADFRVDDLIAYATFGVVPFTLLLLGFLRRRKNLPLKFSKVQVRLFGFVVSLWGLTAFVFSAVMVVSWAYSNHLDLQHNANLWLFWPVDMIFALLGLAFLRSGAPLRSSNTLVAIARFLAKAHIIAAAMAGVLAVAGIIQQDISRVFAVFGICGLMIYLLTFQLTAPKVGTEKN